MLTTDGKEDLVGPDPHASPHLGSQEVPVCNECHKIHRPSEVTCTACHRSFEFDIERFNSAQ